MMRFQTLITTGMGSLFVASSLTSPGNDLAKLEAGKMDVQPEVVDIRAFCALVAGNFESHSIKDKVATDVILQCFRTWIAGHSSDLKTIERFKELAGKKESIRTNKSFSENLNKPRGGLWGGAFRSDSGNLSKSVNETIDRVAKIEGSDFSSLRTFETISFVFDGVETKLFDRLTLKPHLGLTYEYLCSIE